MNRNIWMYLLFRKKKANLYFFTPPSQWDYGTQVESPEDGDRLPTSSHGTASLAEPPHPQEYTTSEQHGHVFCFFPQRTPIMGHLQWNERKNFSSLIEGYQRRKGDTRKMTTMKRKLKLFYWTGSIASHLVYEVITISHIITHDW